MDKDKVALFDAALDKLMGDMDDMEGKGAMAHSQEECPDPFGCKDHEAESSESLTTDASEKKDRMPTLDGAKAEGEEGAEGIGELSPEEAEALKKLLK